MTLYRLCHYLIAGVCVMALIILSAMTKNEENFASGVKDIVLAAFGTAMGIIWAYLQERKTKNIEQNLARKRIILALKETRKKVDESSQQFGLSCIPYYDLPTDMLIRASERCIDYISGENLKEVGSLIFEISHYNSKLKLLQMQNMFFGSNGQVGASAVYNPTTVHLGKIGGWIDTRILEIEKEDTRIQTK
jgi:hypothetical protein